MATSSPDIVRPLRPRNLLRLAVAGVVVGAGVVGWTFVSGRGSHAFSSEKTAPAKTTDPKTATAAVDEALLDPGAEVLPGHSMHGDTFDEGPRRAATLMGSTGNVHMPIAVTTPEAQAFFDQGIGQLHGFWYLEAERSFRTVAKLEPNCAMAYWGMAMANAKNVDRARGFIAEAVKRKSDKLTPIESDWIDLLSTLYAGEGKPDPDAKRALIDTMTAMREKYPNDLELKAFSAYYIYEYKAKEQYESVQTMLDGIFATNPDHPAHHYRIHLLDDAKKASAALGSAAMCGTTSPGIAHMWHMPGHTYTKLGRYADATWQQEASARVDHAYMMRDSVMPYEIHNYAHNNEWLIRDLLLVGRVHDAIDLAKNMIELPRHPKFNESSNRGSGASYGRARLIDALSQHQMWTELLSFSDKYLLDESDDVDQQIRFLRYSGVAHALAGREAQAIMFSGRLQALKESLFEEPAPAAKAAAKPEPTKTESASSEEEAHAEAPPPPQANDAQAKTKQAQAIERARSHISSAIATSKKDLPLAADLLKDANARYEHVALAYLDAGNAKIAQEYAKKAADMGKGQPYPLAVQVIVSQKTGKAEEAKKQFEALRALSADVDLTVEPYKTISQLAPTFGVQGDWRKPRLYSDDIGVRPDLDKLGRFRWQPIPAADFAGATADNSTLSLSSYQGKPVIVIFFLGHSCLHCVLQLQTFGPMAKEFEAAGISIVAISNDDVPALHQAWEAAKLDGGGIPFPLIADSSMDIFNRYHCWDDFENTPIHGTFLIDSKGLVRWQDISAEPFMDAEFLLKESKRLLTVDP